MKIYDFCRISLMMRHFESLHYSKAAIQQMKNQRKTKANDFLCFFIFKKKKIQKFKNSQIQKIQKIQILEISQFSEFQNPKIQLVTKTVIFQRQSFFILKMLKTEPKNYIYII